MDEPHAGNGTLGGSPPLPGPQECGKRILHVIGRREAHVPTFTGQNPERVAAHDDCRHAQPCAGANGQAHTVGQRIARLQSDALIVRQGGNAGSDGGEIIGEGQRRTQQLFKHGGLGLPRQVGEACLPSVFAYRAGDGEAGAIDARIARCRQLRHMNCRSKASTPEKSALARRRVRIKRGTLPANSAMPSSALVPPRSPARTFIPLSYRNGRRDMRMWVVAFEREVLDAEGEQVGHGRIDAHHRQRAGFAR